MHPAADSGKRSVGGTYIGSVIGNQIPVPVPVSCTVPAYYQAHAQLPRQGARNSLEYKCLLHLRASEIDRQLARFPISEPTTKLIRKVETRISDF